MADQLLDGRYRLARRIGSGGMGEVWRAYDENLHRDVAVKLVTSFGLSHDPNAAARFVREARTAARLSSQHIVTVYELGTTQLYGDAAVPYLVMELLDGRPLDVLIHGEDSLPPLAEVARLGGQICKALAAAHAAGVVHRDMKPANVLVTGDAADHEDSLAKVLDFGIARLLDGTSAPVTLTAVGSIVGTPAYMSPEQARGAAPVDARSDLYSLGCILYEMVTGRRPFEAAVWHVLLRMHMDEPPSPPRQWRADLPPAWDELILALLAKDPGDRPQTAGEVRSLLGALERGAALTDAPGAAPGRPSRPSRQPQQPPPGTPSAPRPPLRDPRLGLADPVAARAVDAETRSAPRSQPEAGAALPGAAPAEPEPPAAPPGPGAAPPGSASPEARPGAGPRGPGPLFGSDGRDAGKPPPASTPPPDGGEAEAGKAPRDTWGPVKIAVPVVLLVVLVLVATLPPAWATVVIVVATIAGVYGRSRWGSSAK